MSWCAAERVATPQGPKQAKHRQFSQIGAVEYLMEPGVFI